jgi:hypothetical protein
VELANLEDRELGLLRPASVIDLENVRSFDRGSPQETKD